VSGFGKVNDAGYPRGRMVVCKQREGRWPREYWIIGVGQALPKIQVSYLNKEKWERRRRDIIGVFKSMEKKNRGKNSWEKPRSFRFRQRIVELRSLNIRWDQRRKRSTERKLYRGRDGEGERTGKLSHSYFTEG